MISSIKSLLKLLDEPERKKMWLIVFLMLISAILDTLGVASIMPFMAVLASPDSYLSDETILYFIFNYLKFDNHYEFLFFIGLFVFLLFLMSLALKALNLFLTFRFALSREHSISVRILNSYIGSSYDFFLTKQASDLQTNILSEVQAIVNGGVNPIYEFYFLWAYNHSNSFSSGNCRPYPISHNCSSFSWILWIYLHYLNGENSKNWQRTFSANQRRYDVLGSVLGGIKHVKLSRLENIYAKFFSDAARVFADRQASARILSVLPRFLLEGIAFGGMMLVIL